MAITIIQTLYITAFAFLHERAGFRWHWFGPLAGAFVTAVVLAALATGTGLSAGPAAAEDRMQVAGAFLYVVFCPIHAFITVKLTKALRGGELFERLFIKVLAYGAAAFAAGAVFAVVAMAAALVYTAANR